MKKAPARGFQPARDLTSGLIGKLQDRFGDTIEVSCSSAQEVRPEKDETVMAEKSPPGPVPVMEEGLLEETHPEV